MNRLRREMLKLFASELCPALEELRSACRVWHALAVTTGRPWAWNLLLEKAAAVRSVVGPWRAIGFRLSDVMRDEPTALDLARAAVLLDGLSPSGMGGIEFQATAQRLYAAGLASRSVARLGSP